VTPLVGPEADVESSWRERTKRESLNLSAFPTPASSSLRSLSPLC